jgi:membrane protein DedA with SNARE-associated domain
MLYSFLTAFSRTIKGSLAMENWITQIIEQYGYIGVLLLIALENIFPPIPSEVILTFGGFMTTTTDLSVIGVIIFSTIGSLSELSSSTVWACSWM